MRDRRARAGCLSADQFALIIRAYMPMEAVLDNTYLLAQRRASIQEHEGATLLRVASIQIGK